MHACIYACIYVCTQSQNGRLNTHTDGGCSPSCPSFLCVCAWMWINILAHTLQCHTALSRGSICTSYHHVVSWKGNWQPMSWPSCAHWGGVDCPIQTISPSIFRGIKPRRSRQHFIAWCFWRNCWFNGSHPRASGAGVLPPPLAGCWFQIWSSGFNHLKFMRVKQIWPNNSKQVQFRYFVVIWGTRLDLKRFEILWWQANQAAGLSKAKKHHNFLLLPASRWAVLSDVANMR